jgi:hypothetical protein
LCLTSSINEGDYGRITTTDNLGQAGSDPFQRVFFNSDYPELNRGFEPLRITKRADG